MERPQEDVGGATRREPPLRPKNDGDAMAWAAGRCSEVYDQEAQVARREYGAEREAATLPRGLRRRQE